MAQPRTPLPAGSWDSHLHVIDGKTFPFAEDAPFCPKPATVEQLLEFESSVGIDHVCVIASSVYGTDNACCVDALRRLGGKARGIAFFDPDTITNAELEELHKLGFRGVRLNLRTRSQSLAGGSQEWAQTLTKYANVFRQRAGGILKGWVIQVFVSMDQIATIRPVIPLLNLGENDPSELKVVFDHLGHPEAGSLPVTEQPGAQDLYEILKSYPTSAYVKLSGTFRLAETTGLEKHIQTLLKIAPNQVVWGSDWPWTAGPENNPNGDPKAEQEFLTPDIPKFIADCVAWCQEEDPSLVHKIWVDNPRRLWDYHEDD